MKTIKATICRNVQSISELNNAIEQYGKYNVSTDCYHEFIEEAIKQNIDKNEFIKLIEICSDKMAKNFIFEILTQPTYMNFFSTLFDIEVEILSDHLYNIVIERKLKIKYVPDDIKIEYLNKLAELGLINLFSIENAQSIDVDFIKKYHNDMDLHMLRSVTEKKEIQELIDELSEV